MLKPETTFLRSALCVKQNTCLLSQNCARAATAHGKWKLDAHFPAQHPTVAPERLHTVHLSKRARLSAAGSCMRAPSSASYTSADHSAQFACIHWSICCFEWEEHHTLDYFNKKIKGGNLKGEQATTGGRNFIAVFAAQNTGAIVLGQWVDI
jgi:hypothetical protein